MAHARRSLAIRQALYDRSPEDERARRSLAIGYHYLYDVASAQGDFPAMQAALSGRPPCSKPCWHRIPPAERLSAM